MKSVDLYGSIETFTSTLLNYKSRQGISKLLSKKNYYCSPYFDPKSCAIDNIETKNRSRGMQSGNKLLLL